MDIERFGSSRMPIQSQAGRIQFKVKKTPNFFIQKEKLENNSIFRNAPIHVRNNGTMGIVWKSNKYYTKEASH